MVSNNGTGTNPAAGSCLSTYGDNLFFANASDGTFNPARAVAKR